MTQVLPYNASHRAHVKAVCYKMTTLIYLTIIPLARMGSESIALEAERNNCFSKIQLVGQKYRE